MTTTVSQSLLGPTEKVSLKALQFHLMITIMSHWVVPGNLHISVQNPQKFLNRVLTSGVSELLC